MSNVREHVGGAAAYGVALLDAAGQVTWADEQACRVLGMDAQTLQGCRLCDLLECETPGEMRYVRPDGAVAWLLVETHPETDAHTRVHVRDVTAARYVAEETRRGSERERPAIEGSWVLDPDGLTVAISPSAAALLGYTPDEMRDRSPREFVEPADAGQLAGALERRRAGIRESYEIRWRHRSGEAIWALMAAAPMRDADGEYAGSFALVTDITDRHRVEDQLARQVGQQEAVATLGKAALLGDELPTLHDLAVRMTSDVLDATIAGVFAAEPGRLSLQALHGAPDGTAHVLDLHADDTVPLDASMAAGEPLVIVDWTAQDELVLPGYAADLGVRSTIAVPITGRRLYGVLSASRDRPWQPHDDEVRFLESVAHVLAATQDRAAAEAAGTHRALHDPLTGLPNRTLALDRVEQALRRIDGDHVAVLAVDIDRFKQVNDTHGVTVGDEVVRALGARLSRLAPDPNTVARMHGDAFVIVCDEVDDVEDAGALAGRILEATRRPLHAGEHEFALTVSVGVAIGASGDDGGDLLRDADAALDRAKASGRNRFELFDPALRTRAVARVELERDLRCAAARGELFVAHQPIVSVRSGHVTGTEALVRWRHPERGVVPPGDFIGVAEEAGLIGEIGMWVLRRACADVAAWHRAGRALTCHVNLSPQQAVDPGLPEQVAAVLAETGLAPEALVLELTESALMEAGEGPMRVIQALREQGIRLVLDDFGTGYSSLARLRVFPVDGLKIDRSFVNGLEGDDPQDALLCSAIVEMSRALGLTVVAEGVETTRQLGRLETIGCRYAQGFLLARPAEAPVVDELLRRDSLLPTAA